MWNVVATRIVYAFLPMKVLNGRIIIKSHHCTIGKPFLEEQFHKLDTNTCNSKSSAPDTTGSYCRLADEMQVNVRINAN